LPGDRIVDDGMYVYVCARLDAVCAV